MWNLHFYSQIPKEESEQDFDAKYFGAYKNLNKSRESRASTSVVEESTAHKESGAVSKAHTESILKPPSSSVKIRASGSVRYQWDSVAVGPRVNCKF